MVDGLSVLVTSDSLGAADRVDYALSYTGALVAVHPFGDRRVTPAAVVGAGGASSRFE